MNDLPGSTDVAAIGRRIRLLIAALDLTDSAFARKLGRAQQLVYNYVNDKQRPDLDVALEMWRQTGATLNWIYTGDKASLPVHLAEKIDKAERAGKDVRPEKPRRNRRAS